MDDKEYADVKFVILGTRKSGKSSLMNRYIGRELSDIYTSTIGADIKVRKIEINSILYKIKIWDTSAKRKYSFLHTKYCDVSIVVLCYDITNRHSFLNLEKWVNEIEKHAND